MRESILKFTDFDSIDDFKIKTTPTDNEPRLLAVAVDVKESKAVTFDSYSLSTTYYNYNNQTGKHDPEVMNYPDGMTLQQVMASSSVPIHYPFEEIEKRKFWDGGLLSNTPLRETIQAHTDYWSKMNSEKEVPDLDVYIVSVWPSHQDETPKDNDALTDRKNDIIFADKTEYDIRTSLYVTDYIDLVLNLKRFAGNLIDQLTAGGEGKTQLDQGTNANDNNPSHKTTDNMKKNKKDSLTKELEALFDAKAKSTSRLDEKKKKTYRELIDGKVRLDKVVLIERKDESPTLNVSHKWMDYSKETIEHLIRQGIDYSNTAHYTEF